MSSPLVILILSLLLGLQPITTDLYLPALPALTASFGAVPAQAQLTLTALLLAFGASQLFWGPLSDRVGRRRVLLIGLAGYTLAAVGSALAGSIEVMVFWRVLQGAFMGAGTVCARAIVRDLYPPQEGARAMMPEIVPAYAPPGALILFRMMPRAIAKHVGILTGPDTFLHAYERLGVIEEPLTPTWRRRIAFAFLFPQR